MVDRAARRARRSRSAMPSIVRAIASFIGTPPNVSVEARAVREHRRRDDRLLRASTDSASLPIVVGADATDDDAGEEEQVARAGVASASSSSSLQLTEVGGRVRPVRRRSRPARRQRLRPHDERRAARSRRRRPCRSSAATAAVRRPRRRRRLVVRCGGHRRRRVDRCRADVDRRSRLRWRRRSIDGARAAVAAASGVSVDRRRLATGADGVTPNIGPMSASSVASGALPAANRRLRRLRCGALRDPAHRDVRAVGGGGRGRRDNLVDAERREHFVLAAASLDVAADDGCGIGERDVAGFDFAVEVLREPQDVRVDARARRRVGGAFGCAARGRCAGPALAAPAANATSDEREDAARFTSRASPGGR